jgi:hypothetical protein
MMQYNATPSGMSFRPEGDARGGQPGAMGSSAMPVAPARGVHSQATLQALQDALRSERKLLEDLIGTMQRQRLAVGADDLQGVDDSVFTTHRVLATLGQARQRRRQINKILCGREELSVRELDEVLGAQMSPELRSARDELRAVAQTLSREVETNRRVLREALSTGEQYVRTLVGASDQKGLYGAEGAPSAEAPSPGGLLLNRTA